MADRRRTELKMIALPAMRIDIVPVSYGRNAGGGTVRLGALDVDIGRLGMVCLHTHCDPFGWLTERLPPLAAPPSWTGPHRGGLEQAIPHVSRKHRVRRMASLLPDL